MIDFNQPIKNDLRTCNNIRTITTVQGDNYTVGCLLDYPCIKKKHYKIITIDLNKQETLGADPKAIEQINFTKILNRNGQTAMFFYYLRSKRNE